MNIQFYDINNVITSTPPPTILSQIIHIISEPMFWLIITTGIYGSAKFIGWIMEDRFEKPKLEKVE